MMHVIITRPLLCRIKIGLHRLQYLLVGIPLLLMACNSDQAANNQTIIEAEHAIEVTTSIPVDTTAEDLLGPEREMEVLLTTEGGDILPPPPPPPPPPVIKDDLDCVLPEGFGESSKVIVEAPELEELQEEDEVFSMAEEMPIFPGCDSIDDYRTKKMCGDQKLMKFIYNNITYPSAEKGALEEGLAIVGFVVNKQGKLENIEVVRNPGGGLGKEAARVIELMNTLSQPWVAGKQKGKPVKVQMHLPIRFNLK
ncbi:MAG: energy transducer TonB [Aureispira sp.]